MDKETEKLKLFESVGQDNKSKKVNLIKRSEEKKESKPSE